MHGLEHQKTGDGQVHFRALFARDRPTSCLRNRLPDMQRSINGRVMAAVAVAENRACDRVATVVGNVPKAMA